MTILNSHKRRLPVDRRMTVLLLALFLFSTSSFADVILCFREPENVRTFHRVKMKEFVDPDFFYDDLMKQGVSEFSLNHTTVAIDLKSKMVILDRRKGLNKLFKIAPEKMLTLFSGLPYSDGQDVNIYTELVLPPVPR